MSNKPKIRFKGFNEEWEEKRIGEIIIINPKSNIFVKDIKDNQKGKIPFFTSGRGVLKTNNYLVEGQNLFMNTGGVPDIKFNDNYSNYSTDTFSFKCNDKNSTYFLYYLITNNIKLISSFFIGSTIKHLQKKMLFSWMVKKPSFKEQQKISSLFSSLDNLIDNTEIKLSKLKNLKQSLLSNMFVNN